MVQEQEIRDLYEKCHDRFRYEDGKLFFKRDLNSRQREGQEANRKSGFGYLSVGIDYKTYLVHRIIFLMHHRYLPEMIDHIDRDKTNNRIENLREADKELNSWNRDLQENNTSGYRGVSWNRQAKKWHSYIKIKGKRLHLGFFNTPEEAKEAYEKAKPDT